VNEAKLSFAALDSEVQATVLAALAALSPGPELNSVEADLTMLIAEFGGGYRLLDWELGRPWSEQEAFGGMGVPGPSRMFPVLQLDVLTGLRYYNMGYDTKMYFTPDAFGILPSVVEVNQTTEWVDYVIGCRIGLALNKEFRVWCRGDVGGFQPSRQYSWSVQGGVQWAPYSWLSFVAGYRALDILYQEGGSAGFGFDGIMQGPFLGATFTF